MIEATLDKRYGGEPVLRAATIRVEPGTVHALVGENGAGKSTLVKILAGIVAGDGKLAIDGKPIDLARWNRVRARGAGIGIVQQHGAFAGTLTVVENTVLGAENFVLSLDGVAAALAKRGDELGLPLNPWARVDTLSLGGAQRAEIVAALYQGAKLLILDEPTAVLAPPEVDALLARLRELAKAGTTIIIVTHKLDEVKAVADAVTVLRAGETVATFGAGDLDVKAIAKAMVGAELPAETKIEAPAADAKDALAVESLAAGELRGVSLTVKAGEIVGIAGVDGNGQRELALAIAGLIPAAGRVKLGGRDVTHASAGDRLAHGLAHIPEDRLASGLWLDATLADNLALGRTDVTGGFVLDRGAIGKHADAQIAALDVRPPDRNAIARTLSGGNQQKIVVARELSRPKLVAVVACQPTRGVDLGAVARIHDQLRAAARAGAGVLVISADLDELLALCHRIAVMLRGRLVGENADRAALGELMSGAAR